MNQNKTSSPALALLFAKPYLGPYDSVDPTEQTPVNVATSPAAPTNVVPVPVFGTPTFGGKSQGVLQNASPAAQIITISFGALMCGVTIAPGALFSFSDVGSGIWGVSDTAGGVINRVVARTTVLLL